MQFAALVRRSRARCVELGKVCSESGEMEETPAEPAPMPRGLFAPPALKSSVAKPVVSKETVDPLVNMAMSQYADVQAQALREIANLAEASDDARSMLISIEQLLRCLVKCAASPDRGLHRCAAAALSNFARDCSCHAAIAELGGIKSLLDLASGGNGDFSVELEAQRQSVECLLRLCKGECRGQVAEKGGDGVFADLERDTVDERLRGFASEARVALASC